MPPGRALLRLELAAGGLCRGTDVEHLLLGEAAAVGEDVAGVAGPTARILATGQEQDADRHGDDRDRRRGAVADHLLALLGGTRLLLARLALAAQRLLLISAVRHELRSVVKGLLRAPSRR